jgi:hypothetical protein
MIASLVSCSEPNAIAGPASDDAIARIALPERQLQSMLLTVALRTQTAPMAMYSLGLEQGCEELERAVDSAVQTHLPMWRSNLIAAYRDSVPADELASAAQRDARSAQSALRSHLPKVGAAMQAKSSPLLNEAGAEVLGKLAASADEADQADIDQAARSEELEQAKRSGGICREQIARAGSKEA